MDPFQEWLHQLAYRLIRRQHLSLQMSILARLYLEEVENLPAAYWNTLNYFTSFDIWRRRMTIEDLAILMAYVGNQDMLNHLLSQTHLSQRELADAAEMLAEMGSLQGLQIMATHGPIFTGLVPAVELGSLPMVSFILDSTPPDQRIAFTAFEYSRDLAGPQYLLSEQLRLARELSTPGSSISRRLAVFPQ